MKNTNLLGLFTEEEQEEVKLVAAYLGVSTDQAIHHLVLLDKKLNANCFDPECPTLGKSAAKQKDFQH